MTAETPEAQDGEVLERTKEDYREIIVAIEQFIGKSLLLSYQFLDGTTKVGTSIYSRIDWEVLPEMDFSRTARDLPDPLPRRAIVHICPQCTVEVWETGFRSSGHHVVLTRTIIEDPQDAS